MKVIVNWKTVTVTVVEGFWLKKKNLGWEESFWRWLMNSGSIRLSVTGYGWLRLWWREWITEESRVISTRSRTNLHPTRSPAKSQAPMILLLLLVLNLFFWILWNSFGYGVVVFGFCYLFNLSLCFILGRLRVVKNGEWRWVRFEWFRVERRFWWRFDEVWFKKKIRLGVVVEVNISEVEGYGEWSSVRRLYKLFRLEFAGWRIMVRAGEGLEKDEGRGSVLLRGSEVGWFLDLWSIRRIFFFCYFIPFFRSSCRFWCRLGSIAVSIGFAAVLSSC